MVYSSVKLRDDVKFFALKDDQIPLMKDWWSEASEFQKEYFGVPLKSVDFFQLPLNFVTVAKAINSEVDLNTLVKKFVALIKKRPIYEVDLTVDKSIDQSDTKLFNLASDVDDPDELRAAIWKDISSIKNASDLFGHLMKIGGTRLNMFDDTIQRTYVCDILNMPATSEEEPTLSKVCHFLIVTKSEIDHLMENKEIKQFDLNYSDEQHSDKWENIIFCNGLSPAFQVLNRIHQKGISSIKTDGSDDELFAICLRLKSGRMKDLMDLKIFWEHGETLGLNCLASDQPLKLSNSELNGMAILSLKMPLKSVHDLMRSDENFSSGHLRSYGISLSPLSYPGPKKIRSDCSGSLSYQSLSAIGQRLEMEMSSEDMENISDRALKYAEAQNWFENAQHLMPIPMQILTDAPDHIRKARSEAFPSDGLKPIFASDFDISKYNEKMSEAQPSEKDLDSCYD